MSTRCRRSLLYDPYLPEADQPLSGETPSAPRRTGRSLVLRSRSTVDWMGAVSRAGGGQRQAWRPRTERDHSSVAARDVDRTVAWSRQLNQAHAALRQQLHDVQADLDSAQAGSELLAHCLAFCSVLSAHHQGEDAGLFAELLRVRPDLGDVVRKLIEDHQLIAGILAAVRDLVGEAAHATPERRPVIGRELGGLAAIMESHFGYEERAISDALDDQVQDTGWTTAVFEFRT